MYVTLAKLSFHFSSTRKQLDIQIRKLELMYVNESEVENNRETIYRDGDRDRWGWGFL